MPQSQESFRQELHSLADYLSQKQDDILEDWEKILEEEEEQISNLISISREEFYDHIPTFLDVLCKRLRNKSESAEKIARMHGAERWGYGLDLRETTKEWSKLHQVLMTHVSLSKDSLSLSSAVLEEAQKIVAKSIHNGILNSINEYYILQNREAEAQLRDLKAALQQQEREQLDHSQELQQTSHDLKGVLFSLQTGFSLLENKSLNDDTKEIINDMALATESLDRLLNNLLDLFRLEAGRDEVKITSFNATKILNELCDSMQPLAEVKNLDLRCSGQDALSVQGDRNKVQRIAQNLLINALKYTQEGHVEMSWESQSEEEWMLSISDTGPGLGSTHAASLSTESDSEQNLSDYEEEETHGEGIGLLIVRQLCKLLDAVIEIETEPNEGTTFRIVFPLDYSQ